MSQVKYNIAIDSWRGALDSRKTGQAKRERLVSRYRKGSGETHQAYPMQMHEGPWSEGATANRELLYFYHIAAFSPPHPNICSIYAEYMLNICLS